MKNTNSDPHNFIIDDELRRICVRARSKYQEYCEKKKQLEASSVSDQKLEAILNNIATVNRLKQETLQTIQLLEKDVFASYDKAETLKDSAKMQLEVIKGNSLRKSISTKRKEIDAYDTELKSLDNEKNSLKEEIKTFQVDH